MIRFSVSNTLNQNTVFAIFAKHTKSKHGVWTITKQNQWLISYRRRALGNSPRRTLSIYCPAARKYRLVWFAKLIRACMLWQSIAHIVQDASWHKRSKNALCKVLPLVLSQTPVQFKHCVCNYSVNTALWITMFDLNCLLQTFKRSHFDEGSFANQTNRYLRTSGQYIDNVGRGEFPKALRR